jgi:hypothetical protein
VEHDGDLVGRHPGRSGQRILEEPESFGGSSVCRVGVAQASCRSRILRRDSRLAADFYGLLEPGDRLGEGAPNEQREARPRVVRPPRDMVPARP